MDRPLWIATGAAWATSSLVLLAGASYWEPVTLLDWTAVLSYTVAWLLLAGSVLLMARLVPRPLVRVAAIAVALAAGVTGLANLAEDGFDIQLASTFYVAGSLLSLATLVVLAITLVRGEAPRLGAFTVALAVGMFLVVAGGGLLILALFVVLAARTAWFMPHRGQRVPLPEHPAA